MLNRLFQITTLTVLLGCSYQVLAQTQQRVQLFLQENLDVKGKQLPIDNKLSKLLHFVEQAAGVKFDYVQLPWRRAQRATLAGNGIIYGFSKSNIRLTEYRFSEPLIIDNVWAISLGEPTTKIRSLEDLRGKKIAIGHGYSYGIEFERTRDKVFSVQEDTASVPARFEMLVSKRCDFLLWPVHELDQQSQVEEHINNVIVANLTDENLKKYRFFASENPIFHDTIHFAAAHGQHTEILDKIDHAITQGKKDGSLAKALKDYH
ncbi:MAG: transporter substrate-binding domain-containing protein [Undibacterium sp.]|nr:transporter substrate-binding domain-containing protein [Undibacterium sp.]